MNNLIEAIETKDYMQVKSLFEEAMKEKTLDLIENRKIELAKSIMVEGEDDPEKDDEDETDDGDDEKDDESDEDEGDEKDDKEED